MQAQVKTWGNSQGIHQGDILKIEKIKNPVLVTSKDFLSVRRNYRLSYIFESFDQSTSY